jgi:antitoxin component of RelBE/YafQ-DinJ toxin-antitoxin module
MAQTVFLKIRIDPDLKRHVEVAAREQGLCVAAFLRMLATKQVRTRSDAPWAARSESTAISCPQNAKRPAG